MKEFFEGINAPKQPAKVKHNLLEIPVLAVCAMISGCDNWEDIADFCRVKEQWFRKSLGLEPKNGVPSHDTMGRVFGLIKPEEFNACFVKWVSSICKEPKQIISVDGKTVRGSKDKDKSALHMVSARASENGIVPEHIQEICNMALSNIVVITNAFGLNLAAALDHFYIHLSCGFCFLRLFFLIRRYR